MYKVFIDVMQYMNMSLTQKTSDLPLNLFHYRFHTISSV